MRNYTLKIILLLLTTGLFYSCSQDDSSFIDGLPDSVVNNDPPGSPPRGLTESWNEHSEVATRQSFDAFAAVYFDPEVDRTIEWPLTYFSEVWAYTTETYGDFGSDNILYVIGHGEESSAFTKTIFDNDASNRSLVDLSITNADLGIDKKDEISALISSIIENSSNGVHLSPASAVWQNKFSEIFTYDLYLGLGMEEEAQRVATTYSESSVNFPAENSFWFRDWFLPIYENYSGSTTLNNFFNILSKNYPIDGDDYAGEMNVGEMVHFFSGAAGEDLQHMAEAAFGWNDEWAGQLLRAQAQFPNLNYPFEPASQIIDLTTNATITVSKDNDSGPDSNEGSLKLIDTDINTKFLTGGFPQEFWMQQNFTEGTVSNKYTFTSGNDAPDRDLKDWELLGSNDGENWDVLDTRTDQSFSERNQTKEFNFENEQEYLYYRINVLANNGGGLLQISEWRLLKLELLDFGPTDFTENATITVSRENGGGPDGGEGSTKIIDNDLETKFLVGGFPDPFWMQQNFTEAVIVTKYNFTSGNDAPDRDPVDWTLSGSNDGDTWDVLDTRADQSFSDRNQTREFLVTNDTPYLYYRIDISKNNGSDAMQMSEWRLLGDN
ncbi:MAG: discoidin domain-containing protein [Leeuwenhoekiella sp.]